MAALSPKQEMFCKEYIIDLNATQAAIRAGYSVKTAKEIGYENLTKPHIAEKIQELFDKRSEKAELSADMVLQELMKTAFIKEADFYHDDGSVKMLSELTDDQKSALQFYQFKQVHVGDGVYESVPVFKAQDKMKAIELLGKHLKMFTDKVEHSGEVSLNTIIDRLQGKQK